MANLVKTGGLKAFQQKQVTETTAKMGAEIIGRAFCISQGLPVGLLKKDLKASVEKTTETPRFQEAFKRFVTEAGFVLCAEDTTFLQKRLSNK
jgi:hypothetical protein